MLKREKNFDKRDFEMLFGDTFLKTLMKIPKADAVLAAIPTGRSGGQKIRLSSGGRVVRGYNAAGSSQVSRFNESHQHSSHGGFQFANYHQPIIWRWPRLIQQRQIFTVPHFNSYAENPSCRQIKLFLITMSEN